MYEKIEDEKIIIKGLKDGDNEAYQYIYDQYYKLFLYINKTRFNSMFNMDDVMQEVMFKLFKSINSFSFQKATSFKCWLGMLGEHVMYDMLRKELSYQQKLKKLIENERLNINEKEIFGYNLMELLNMLPNIQYNICLLKCVYHYTIKKIANILEIDFLKAQSQYQKALKMLKKIIENKK